jgi:hypothetical protein
MRWLMDEDMKKGRTVVLCLYQRAVPVPETSDCLLMCLEHLHIIHVTLPVFHVARMISCNHPHIIMGPYHSSHWAVMCL